MAEPVISVRPPSPPPSNANGPSPHSLALFHCDTSTNRASRLKLEPDGPAPSHSRPDRGRAGIGSGGVPVGVLEDGLDAVEVARDHPVRPVRDRDRLLRAANTARLALPRMHRDSGRRGRVRGRGASRRTAAACDTAHQLGPARSNKIYSKVGQRVCWWVAM